MGEIHTTHTTMTYLLQNLITATEHRVHLTRSNCFSLMWHSKKISNNTCCREVSLTCPTHILGGEQVTLWFLHPGFREQNQSTACVCAFVLVYNYNKKAVQENSFYTYLKRYVRMWKALKFIKTVWLLKNERDCKLTEIKTYKDIYTTVYTIGFSLKVLAA